MIAVGIAGKPNTTGGLSDPGKVNLMDENGRTMIKIIGWFAETGGQKENMVVMLTVAMLTMDGTKALTEIRKDLSTRGTTAWMVKEIVGAVRDFVRVTANLFEINYEPEIAIVVVPTADLIGSGRHCRWV